MALLIDIMSSSASMGGIVSCAMSASSASSTMVCVMGVDICVWYAVRHHAVQEPSRQRTQVLEHPRSQRLPHHSHCTPWKGKRLIH